MGFINVFISKPCRVHIKEKQLVVAGEEEHSFPIEDINTVLMETADCTVTAATLQSLADAGAVVFVCDKKHLPSGVLLPFNTYYRPLKILDLQLSASKPVRKQLWQAIVRQKIFNQATCLSLCREEGEEKYLFDLAKEVVSDDARNSEAVAANYYFRKLFGEDFTRGEESARNAALNYGYTLIRGAVARTLVVYGFETGLGVHHCNQLNNFNLADDIMEPYRPVVDLLVYGLPAAKELTTGMKRTLFSLFNTDVEMEGQRYALSYAVELTVQSLRAVLEGKRDVLTLPTVVRPKLHRYE